MTSAFQKQSDTTKSAPTRILTLTTGLELHLYHPGSFISQIGFNIPLSDYSNIFKCFISLRGAEIAYIDVEFSMMKCDNLESSCKETFNLYYFESDRDDASSTFPPWRENPYIKIDTIAGERFSTSDRDVNEGINFKTWSIGPLTKSVSTLTTTGLAIKIETSDVFTSL